MKPSEPPRHRILPPPSWRGVICTALACVASWGCRGKTAAPPPGPRGPQVATTRASAPLPAAASPKAVARAFNAACRTGDVERALSFVYAATEAERDAVRAAVGAAVAMERLRKAVAERWGPAAEYELDFGMPRDEEFDDAVERVEGDRAWVTMAEWKDLNDPKRLKAASTGLVRRGGRWLLDVHGVPGTQGWGDDPRHAALLARAFERSADLTVAEVKAGKYSEPSEVAGAFRSRPFTDEEAFRDLIPPDLTKPDEAKGEP